MKAVFAVGLALALCVGAAGSADAAAARKHKKKHWTGQSSPSAYRSRQRSEPYNSNAASDWHPHDSSQLPFGSKLWWQQKERESGGTRD